ncbi:MAG: MOSC N-terminal beta barrel domain-containing protein [Patescibacteria group bacterium]
MLVPIKTEGHRIFVTGLFIYPIKSCKGIAVQRAEVTPFGFEHDRRFVLTDEHGKFITQRTEPRLALVHTHIEGSNLLLSAPGMDDISFDISHGSPEAQETHITMHRDTCAGLAMEPSINAWFSSFLKTMCFLNRYSPTTPRIKQSSYLQAAIPVSYADGYPFLVVSEQSLNLLNTKLAAPVTMARFRPNIVVTGPIMPHDEDMWKEVCIGNEVILSGASRSPRCVMITVDPSTGVFDRNSEPMRTLATYRKEGSELLFGRNFTPTTNSSIKLDDTVRVISVL